MLKSRRLPTQFYIIFLLSLILIVVFASFRPVLKNDFVFWDDDTHVYENILIRTLDMEHIRGIFTSTIHKTYIPLTALSFALEYHFFQNDPFIYHLDNVLIHLGVVALVFWLGLRLGLSPVGSGCAALLFGIHPMRVESVAWVTERKDVLYSFFYVAALISYTCYLNFTKSTPSFQIEKSYRFLVLTVFFGILSMLAKPMALSLPLILLLFDWFHGRKMNWSVLIEKIPLGIAIGGLTLVTYLTHARIPGKGMTEAFLVWAWTFIFYLRQFLFPLISLPVYQMPKPIALAEPEYLLSVLTVCFLVIALFRFRRHRWFIFAIGYFIFSIFFLLRYDDAVDANIVADRFMYLPSLGLCFLAGLGCSKLMKHKWAWPVGAVFLILLVPLLAVKTYRQCFVWRDSISLWRYQLSVFPNQPIALNNLATALREEKDYKAAEQKYKQYKAVESEGLVVNFSGDLVRDIQKVEHVMGLYQRAIRVEPRFIESYYNFGNLYRDVGMIPEAVEAYKSTLKLDYTYKDAHFSLGELYLKAGDFKQAIFAFNQILALYPGNEDVYVMIASAYNEAIKDEPKNMSYRTAREKILDQFVRLVNGQAPGATSFFNLGHVYSGTGDLARAESAYQMALDVNPNHVKTLYNLGNLYRDQARWKDALSTYQRVVQMDPKKSDAFLNMGTVYGRQGQLQRAEEYFQKAIDADGGNARAYFDLGYMKEREGQFQEALRLYRRSIDLDEFNTEVHYNLGNVLARLGKGKDAITAYLKAVEIDVNYMDAWINLSILSYKENEFDMAVKYCDQAVLLGYNPPQGYRNALAPHRAKKLSNIENININSN